jgi:hypothetical protein
MKTFTIYRCICKACGKEFCGLTQKKANATHKEHIKSCETIIAIEKVYRFHKAAEKILGHKISYKKTYELLGIKIKKRRAEKEG